VSDLQILALSTLLMYAAGAWSMARHVVPDMLWKSRFTFSLLWPVLVLIEAALWGLIYGWAWISGWDMEDL